MTARELIEGSLRLIGAIAVGETPSADEASDGLSALNDMVASWSNESLTVYSRVREEFLLVSGTGDYTIGDGGTFDTSSPLEIEEARIEVLTNTPNLEIPLEIINLAQRASIAQKSLQSTYPTKLYFEQSHPLGVISLWPVPNAANNLVLYSRKPLGSFATLSTDVDLPPGYLRALRYNLAMELAPEYGKEPSQTVMMIAVESKANLKRQNMRPVLLDCDPGILGKGNSFNYLTGE